MNFSGRKTNEGGGTPPTVGAGAGGQRGFALLITVTLLAFIVILLLGLAVYTRVETAVAGNTQRQAQARENALLALNIAIAQLQKHAGPDRRVTAPATHFGAIDGTRHFTGVWSSDPAVAGPLTWLVSGNEKDPTPVPDPNPDAPQGSLIPGALAVTPADPGTVRREPLVAANSTGARLRNASWVDAPVVDLRTTGVPGLPPNAPAGTIGRYAWWVGDQGIKAPVAVADSVDAVNFPPFDSGELNSRIRQQVPLGAGAMASGAIAFEPRDSNNAPLVANHRITSTNQIGFLRTGSLPVGFALLQQNFHTWSPNNHAVLANTKDGGLRQDLSLLPTLLGPSFAAWANYPAYMEKLVPEVTVEVTPPDGEAVPAVAETPPPAILPAYSADPLRRRYVMTPHTTENASRGSHQVGPVLTYFLLTFNVRTVGESSANAPLEVRARWVVSLWNPYTSALVPETLRIEVSRLPRSVQVVNDNEQRSGPVGQPFSLQATYGSPMSILLPWDGTGAPEGAALEDRQSWLPGRVYSWRSVENIGAGTPAEGFASAFYSQRLSDSGAGAVRPLNVGTVIGSDNCHLEVNGFETMLVTLFAVRPSGDVRLGAFTSAPFEQEFSTTSQEARLSGYQFSYVFRLAESIDSPAAPGTWLLTPGRDLRHRTLRSESFVVGDMGNNPATYNDSNPRILYPDRLLSRGSASVSYNEDVPIYELPRAPLLSLGSLQHFRLLGQRPFMIGNPWGFGDQLNGVPLGQIFDRFFFSGVAAGVVPTPSASGDLILPNPLLRPLRKSDGSKPTLEDLRPAPPPVDETAPAEPLPTEAVPTEPAPGDPEEPPATGEPAVPATPSDYVIATRSSKHLLQGGAFNLNSANADAWTAVLRSVRFPAPQSFRYLDVSATTGTAADTAVASVESPDAHFFRFSQSAQETYKAEAGQADSSPEAAASPANTHLFRQGMRTLDATQVTAFAEKIVELVALKHAAADGAGGPFRTLEEFLSPSPLFSGVDAEGNALAPRSLLEAAIADAGLNSSVPEFSSQWLTQADVMTSLAPILFPRSDTFVIRTYGEAVNPATGATEGRAWCEAVVQRLPQYFDPSLPPESLPGEFEPVANPDDPAAEPTSTQAQALNKLYGRRFKVISFRWLTRADI